MNGALPDATLLSPHYRLWGRGASYAGPLIERLSPGTRGIVLLLLYLAVHIHDRRPLLIDQPEENLDPHSVISELVPHFRIAKKRRQIIMVAHMEALGFNLRQEAVLQTLTADVLKGAGVCRFVHRTVKYNPF
jgi:predicted ATPase